MWRDVVCLLCGRFLPRLPRGDDESTPSVDLGQGEEEALLGSWQQATAAPVNRSQKLPRGQSEREKEKEQGSCQVKLAGDLPRGTTAAATAVCHTTYSTY